MFLVDAGTEDFPVSMLFNSKLFSPENMNKSNSFELTVLTPHAKLTRQYSHLLTPNLDVTTINEIEPVHLNTRGKQKPVSLLVYIKSEFDLELQDQLRNHSGVILKADYFVYFLVQIINNYRPVFPGRQQGIPWQTGRLPKAKVYQRGLRMSCFK